MRKAATHVPVVLVESIDGTQVVLEGRDLRAVAQIKEVERPRVAASVDALLKGADRS
jgi:hypothetical protein